MLCSYIKFGTESDPTNNYYHFLFQVLIPLHNYLSDFHCLFLPDPIQFMRPQGTISINLKEKGGSAMQVSEATKFCLDHHKSHSKENSIRAYTMILSKFCEEFGAENLEDITTEKVLSFLNHITEGRKRETKRTRYSHLLAFFNFIKNNTDQDFRNPCDTPMLKKLFRSRPSYNWDIIEKETVDEIIFRTSKPRNRLILELMARGGMRISEVLKLTPSDINDRRLTLRDPKSGREQEFIFIPQRLAGRLNTF